MKKIVQSKKLFVAKIFSVQNVQENKLDINTPCEIAPSSYGYRLIYKTGTEKYIDVLTGQTIKSLDQKDLNKDDLIVNDYIRPLYRYSKSLKVGEIRKNVKAYAKYVEANFNKETSKNHRDFYKINNLVRKCHNIADTNVIPVTKKELMMNLFSDNKSVQVDELFVIKTKVVDDLTYDNFKKIESCNAHEYDYRLAIRKWNGKFIDALTKEEIKPFNDKVQIGDVIIEKTRPLYRYAKSLKLVEELDDVEKYAKYVKENFNEKYAKNNHTEFYKINKFVRKCHSNKIKQERQVLLNDKDSFNILSI